MDLDSVKRYLEKGGDQNASKIDAIGSRYFDPFVMQGLHVDLIEPGRIVCSYKVPPRLLVQPPALHLSETTSSLSMSI